MLQISNAKSPIRLENPAITRLFRTGALITKFRVGLNYPAHSISVDLGHPVRKAGHAAVDVRVGVEADRPQLLFYMIFEKFDILLL